MIKKVLFTLFLFTAAGCYNFHTKGYIHGKQVEFNGNTKSHPCKDKEKDVYLYKLKIGWRNDMTAWYIVTEKEFNEFELGNVYPFKEQEDN